ncbi:MAG: nucleoside triphosphate pyrophosphatase [Chloroflexota bacterium]
MERRLINRADTSPGAPLILASASPRRRELVTLLDRRFTLAAADIDETPAPDERPEQLPVRLARAKAEAIARRSDTSADAIVLAADTVVVLDDAFLNKPADNHEALLMLTGLRGRDHRVMTGIALASRGQVVWSAVVDTTVWMREYTLQEMALYVKSGLPLDKAGGYGIQDGAFHPVERINGCFPNVVGLPLCEVERGLAAVEPLLKAGLLPREAQQGVVRGSCGALCQRAREFSAWLPNP